MLTYSRRKKQLKEAKVWESEVDRISNLPDALLIHILSFLLTKDSVKTSSLSTRWKSLWASVPSLNVSQVEFRLKAEGSNEDNDKTITTRLSNFVDKQLIHRRVSYMENVCIWGYVYDPSRVESWICAAVELNVRELELQLQLSTGEGVAVAPEIPQSLFSCSTLVVLRLCLEMVLNFPVASVCFPNLKVLCLCGIIYKDDESAQNLLSSCPVLEDLLIVRYQLDQLQTLNVTARALKKLSVDFTLDGDYGNLHKLVIDAPGLKSLDIEDQVTKDYVVKDLSSIVRVKLDISLGGLAAHHAVCLFELLKRICNVKYLSLSDSTTLCLMEAHSYNLPTFHNLTHLELGDGDDGSWKLVLEFLRSSPILEVLIFKGSKELTLHLANSQLSFKY